MSTSSEQAKQWPNILKVRDDREPIGFDGADGKFVLDDFADVTWPDGDSKEFTQRDLRTRIEPWLTSLFQSEHLSLLAGSGLTHAIHQLATGKLAAGMNALALSNHNDKINASAKRSAVAAGRKAENLEDQLRVANELLRGLEILGEESEAALRTEITNGMGKFAESILASESGIVSADDSKREDAFNTLVTFLMSFASRTGVRDRLNIFTTNYDRLIEAGAELAGLHLLDRFLGTLTPIFRSSRLDLDMHYNPPGIRGEPRYLEGVARFTKLHGSVDWIQVDKDIRRIGLPFGASDVAPFLKAPGLDGATAHELMIYPNAAKDRETADYPYVELFRDFAAAICRPNSTLVTYGYSFGDEHINRVIRDMLKRLLDLARTCCKGQDQPFADLCHSFNKATADGRNMRPYSDLLGGAIRSMIEVKEEKDIDSLFSPGKTSALTQTISGLDDFELISFLVVQEAA